MPGMLIYFVLSLRTRIGFEHHKTSSVHVSTFLSVREILGRLLLFQYYQNVIKTFFVLIFFYIKSNGIFATGFNEDRIRAKILTEGLFFKKEEFFHTNVLLVCFIWLNSIPCVKYLFLTG